MDLILEPILTRESLLDLSQIPESVVVPALPEFKSIIPSFHNPFWDKGIDKIDPEIILKIRWGKILNKNQNAYIIIVGCIIEVSCGFL